jgi:hypothetical protein
MLFAANAASAQLSVQTKTRVWDFSSTAPLNTWLEADASPRTHLENQSSSEKPASASPHAARGASVVPRAAGAGESAFSIASRGGRHAGFLQRASSMSPRELQRTASTLQKRIEIHEGYIGNPLSHVPNWNSLRPAHQQNLLNHWGQEITTFAEQQSIVQQLLR